MPRPPMFPTLSARRELQRLYEHGVTHEKLAEHFGTSRNTIDAELKRGYEKALLPNGRRVYNAEKAQSNFENAILQRYCISESPTKDEYIRNLEERIRALEASQTNNSQSEQQ